MVQLSTGVSRLVWVRTLALILGVVIFLMHVVNLKVRLPISTDILRLSLQDLLAHFMMFITFTFTYRLSFAGYHRHTNRTVLVICMLWGACCECAQLLQPSRNFNLWELAANMLAPVFVISMFTLFQRK